MFSLYLLAVIFVTFVVQLFVKGFTESFWLVPNSVASHPWTLITSMFLHGGFTHILFNGFALYMFGPYLEQLIGSKRFLVVYFVSGIAGGLAYVASALYLPFLSPALPALGASGAIFGVLGAVAVLRPNLPVLMLGFIPMRMTQAVAVWVLLALFDTINVFGGVAGAAHLGGLAVGAVIAYYYLRRELKKNAAHDVRVY